MPEDYERNYGPWVEAKGLPGFKASVLRTYRGDFKAPVLWRGKVCVAYNDRDLFDIEGALLESKNRGEPPYFAMPERSYESGGATKYLKQVYIHDKALVAAMSECVRLELGDSSVEEPPVDDDDIPL